MTDDTNLARPGITSPIGSPGDFRPVAQPMTIRTADVGAVETVLVPDVKMAPVRAAGLVKIAGLGNLVQGVRDQITELRTNGAALQESVAALNLTMQGIKQQVDATHDDLKFEAETLGNGSGS